MRLARATGLDVLAVHRLYAPQPVYIVDRFDRVGMNSDAADAVRRRHVIDTCQLLNKSRTFKYTAARLDTLSEAIRHCRSKAAARLQLFRWVAFNALVGNGDNHIKNISFIVDAGGINVAPAYDLLCTAVYDTKAMANENAKWPGTALAFSLGDVYTFADVRRDHVLEAGRILGLAEATAERELVRMLKAVPAEADKLIAEIGGRAAHEAATCPEPDAAAQHIAGELRLLAAIRHIVLADMCRQLA
jgi:serine/threonine-protein kinase HipA